MARIPKPRWHRSGCFCSDIGEPYSDKKGRPRRKTVYFHGIPRSDRRAAQDAVEAYLRARDDRTVAEGQATLADLAQLYLAWSEKNAAPLTYTGHRKILLRLLKGDARGQAMGRKAARELTATDLARVVGAWAKAGRKPNYVARMVASVQAVLNWSADPLPDRDPERLIDGNPLRGFSHEATRAGQAPDRYAAEGEVRAFLAFLRGRADGLGGLVGRFEHATADLIEVAALTGSRPGELRVAEWGDFEPAAVEVAGEVWGRITLDKTRWKAGRKTGKPREIFLPPEAVAIIGRLRDHPHRHPAFIWAHRRGARSAARGAVREQGEPWTLTALCTKVATLRRAAIAAGVPLADGGENRFTMYRLRHTAAARLLMAEVPVATVARLLGTSPDMVVRTYQSYLSRHLVEAAALGLGRRISPPSPSGGAEGPADPPRPSPP